MSRQMRAKGNDKKKGYKAWADPRWAATPKLPVPRGGRGRVEKGLIRHVAQQRGRRS